MGLRIISWNCNMAFRKKYEKITSLKPDLLVLQECENADKLKSHLNSIRYNDILWYGKNPHKGVAIISFNEVRIKLRKKHNTNFEFIVPVEMKVDTRKINLYCIWAMPHKKRLKSYVGQIWGAINHYENALNNESLLIGDFNSNTIWDKERRIGNHSDVVNFLNKKNIFSIYHQKKRLKHGKEKHPTLFLLKKMARPYHIDYCFASKSLYSKKTRIKIGKYEDWIKLSDHMPIIIDHIVS